MFAFAVMDLPELVSFQIAGYLDTKSYLRLRRVSKSMREWIDEAIFAQRKSQMFTGYEVQIFQDLKDMDPNFTEMKTFENYLNSGLTFQPNCSLHLKNSSMWIFKDPALPQFLEKFGSRIRKLKVDLFQGCETDRELNFYESLVNLEELELDFLDVDNMTQWDRTGILPDRSRLPETFRKLSVLKLNSMEVSLPRLGCDYLWRLFDHCPLLETLNMPLLPKGYNDCIDHFTNVVKRRMEKYPQGTKVKFIDLKNLDKSEQAGFWNDFTDFCAENGIKLLNVHAENFSDVRLGPGPQYNGANYDKCIISIHDLHPKARSLRLPNLEGIVIKSMNVVLDLEEDSGSEWPLLKSVKIHFDDRVYRVSKERAIYRLLFENFDRSSVRELGLSFERTFNEKTTFEAPFCMTGLIVQNYGGLKILSISGWDGLSKWFKMLWGGLPQLEELEIEDCRTLDDFGFIGVDFDAPIFLTLTKLRKLSLKGLDSMPEVTDNSFIDVFQHMKLSTLILTCDQPFTKITREGISALASPNNAFSKSIDKFPFKGWELAGETPETFAQLRDQFRCNQ